MSNWLVTCTYSFSYFPSQAGEWGPIDDPGAQSVARAVTVVCSKDIFRGQPFPLSPSVSLPSSPSPSYPTVLPFIFLFLLLLFGSYLLPRRRRQKCRTTIGMATSMNGVKRQNHARERHTQASHTHTHRHNAPSSSHHARFHT